MSSFPRKRESRDFSLKTNREKALDSRLSGNDKIGNRYGELRPKQTRLEQGRWPAARDRAALAKRCGADARLHECRGAGTDAAKWKSDVLQPQQAAAVDEGRDVRPFSAAQSAACGLRQRHPVDQRRAARSDLPYRNAKLLR